MAAPKDSKGLFIPSAQSQQLLLDYVKRIVLEHKRQEDYAQKMETIDIAYARYKSNVDPVSGIVREEGIDAAHTPVGVHALPSTTPPIVVSQVDSMVGYLADVFLSGYPIFPIVSSPADKADAEALEALIDDHSVLGGYPRQLLMFLRDCVKYNMGALEVDWKSIEQYTSMDELLEPGTQKVQTDNKSYTSVQRSDPYNTIWDRTVAPGDVSKEGDYAGHVKLLSRTKLKRLLNRLSNDGEVFNTAEALAAGYVGAADYSAYRVHPQISKYVAAKRPLSEINWYSYLTGRPESSNSDLYSENYELLTLYVRIQPGDFYMNVPGKRTPQIWKLLVVNQNLVVQAKRIISAYDCLPMIFGQPYEDGLGYQTQSLAEANIPFQDAASTLLNIRFNAARRAVSDRALYDPTMISPSDINAPVPAPKIPVRLNKLDSTRKISDYYHQIPFDARGTESTVQDARMIFDFSKDLMGINGPQQGQFQRGNKSVKEWNDVMGNSDNRLRCAALCLEFQVFVPLKEILKLNIMQYGDDAIVVSRNTGESIMVKISQLRKKVLAFRVADGFTPKSKLASADMLRELMLMISQSPILQQAYGPGLADMFAHLAQLGGVRDLSQYKPNDQQMAQFQQQQIAMEQAKKLPPPQPNQGAQ